MKLYALSLGRYAVDARILDASASGRTSVPVWALLIRHEQGNLLFDLGCAAEDPALTAGPGETLEAQLARLGMTAGDVGTAVISHFHGDHFGALPLLTHADVYVPAEDWTMDDFLALCRQFAKPEDGVWGYAIDGYSDTMYPWMYLFGADYMDRTTHTSLLDQPNQLKGFTTLYQLIEDGACMSVAQTNEFGGVTSAFATNHAAMLFGGLSKANGISDMTDDFIVMPLPTGASNEKQSHIFCNCWAIPTVSTQPAWAWKVIEYFSSMEGQTIACNAEMGLPATPAADTTEWVAAKPWRKYYLDALGYEKSQPYPVDTYGPN